MEALQTIYSNQKKKKSTATKSWGKSDHLGRVVCLGLILNLLVEDLGENEGPIDDGDGCVHSHNTDHDRVQHGA